MSAGADRGQAAAEFLTGRRPELADRGAELVADAAVLLVAVLLAALLSGRTIPVLLDAMANYAADTRTRPS